MPYVLSYTCLLLGHISEIKVYSSAQERQGIILCRDTFDSTENVNKDFSLCLRNFF